MPARYRPLWTIPLFLVATLGAQAAPEPEETPAVAQWKTFRKQFPHPIQTLAVSRPDKNGARVLIISEPPPRVTEEQLRKHAPELADLKVETHAIGFGGCVKDVVVQFKGDDAQVGQLVSSLSRLLFGTAYKAYALELPAKPGTIPPKGLDLKGVSPVDLENWLGQGKAKLVPVEGGKNRTLAELSKHPRSVVCATENKSIVVWWLPKAVRLQDCPVQCRQFALDSDLLLGAFSNDHGLFILGRGRVVPLDVLPPLRTETMSLLAGVRHDQLAQSFERFSAVAGPWKNNYDWAPAYLSPELVNTEYGLLLVIADMIIKAWSNAGLTNYEGFHSTRPASWPFGKDPLPKAFDLKMVTYNWNTAGAGYRVGLPGFDVLALHRTGALPVSYIPGSGGPAKLQESEEKAYNYFASLNDPQLVQVVRYAGFYQICRAYRPASDEQPLGNYWPTTLLLQQLENLLVIAKSADAKLITAMVDKALERVPEANRMANRQPLELDFTKGRNDLKDLSDPELKRLAAMLATVRDGPSDPNLQKLQQVLQYRFRLLLRSLAAQQNFPTAYAKAAADKAKGWIQTPVVVVSTNTGVMASFEGGHNVDAAVPRFVPDKSLNKNEIRVELDEKGKIIIRFSPEDAGRVGGLSRMVGRLTKAGRPVDVNTLEEAAARTMKGIPPPPKRTQEDALGSPPPPPPRDPSGLAFPDDKGPRRGLILGWAPDPERQQEASARLQRARELLPDCIVVEQRRPNYFEILHDVDGAPIAAFSSEAALDALAHFVQNDPNQPSRDVVIIGLTPEQSLAFSETYRLHRSLENEPTVHFFVIEPNTTLNGLRQALQTPFNFAMAEFPAHEVNGSLLQAKVKATAGNKATLEISSMVKFKNPPAMALQQRVADTHRDVVRKLFPANVIMDAPRRTELLQRFRQAVAAISQQTGESMEVVALRFRLEAGNVVVTREEHENAPQCLRTE